MNGILDQLNINGKIQDNIEIKGTIQSNELKGTIQDDNKIIGTLTSQLSIVGSVGNTTTLIAHIQPGITTFPTYTGEYIIIPSLEEQILETKNKITRENVEVKEIPYSETSNDYGYTVTIA